MPAGIQLVQVVDEAIPLAIIPYTQADSQRIFFSFFDGTARLSRGIANDIYSR